MPWGCGAGDTAGAHDFKELCVCRLETPGQEREERQKGMAQKEPADVQIAAKPGSGVNGQHRLTTCQRCPRLTQIRFAVYPVLFLLHFNILTAFPQAHRLLGGNQFGCLDNVNFFVH